MKPWLVAHRDNPHAVRVMRPVQGQPGVYTFGTYAAYIEGKGQSWSFGLRSEATRQVNRNRRHEIV